MAHAHYFGPGDRQWFRRCRRAWDLGSRNRQNWALQSEPRTLDAGRAVRDALAVYYFPGMWEWPRGIVHPRAIQAFEESLSRQGSDHDGFEQTLDAGRRLLEAYFEWAPGVDAFVPVRVETDFEANIPDPDQDGHDLVAADGRPFRYRDRVQLLAVDAGDAYWVVEHRLTTDGWAEEDALLLDEPSVTGAWGWEQFYLGMVIAGTVYNELRLDRAGDWFRRSWIPRSRPEVAGMGERLSAEAAEMLDPRLRVYPSPTPEHCGPCAYRDPCLAMNRGDDVAGVLAAGYRVREDDQPEEGRLGGGTWSMNRGAAPPPQWRNP